MGARVCIGFAEALSGPEVVWSLVDAGFQVVAFTRRGRRSALQHSRYVVPVEITPPELDQEAALTDLEKLLALWTDSSNPQVLLPLDDAALWLCSLARRTERWILAGPRGERAEFALDKWIQVEAARAAGLKVPETTLAHVPEDVFGRANSFPLVLKPARAVCPVRRALIKGQHWICANQRDLDRAVTEWNAKYPLLVQPFLRGTGEGIFGLATDEGVRAWSAHRRIRMMNPHGSGSSACMSQPVPLALTLRVENFVRQTGWRGLFMAEFLRDREGVEWFVEFNGRCWGSMALSRRQGLEYPAWNVRLAIDPEARVTNSQVAQKPLTCRNVGRECMHLLFLLRGPKSSMTTDWPRFWPTVMEMLRIQGEQTLYNWRRDDAKVFFWDWWYVIRDQVFKRAPAAS